MSSQLMPPFGLLAKGNIGHGLIAQAEREAGFWDHQAVISVGTQSSCHALGKAGGWVQLGLLMLRAVRDA